MGVRGRQGRPAVVVPAIGAPSSVTVLRSFGGTSVHSIAISEQETPPAFWSRYCDETVEVPTPDDDLAGYRDALLSLARREAVRAITPMREVDVYVLAKYRDEFAEHLTPVWPTFEQLTVVHDRESLLAAAERAAVPTPRSRPLDEVDDWDAERIVKARYALLTEDYVDDAPVNGCGHPPKTIYLEPGVGPDVDAIVDGMGHVPMAQEYLDGTEYCFRALCRDGESLVTSQKRLVRGYKYPRGPSIYHEAVDLPRLEELGVALLAELEWNGLASVGFIRDDQGTFRLLEINPRFWSSLPMDVHAAVDYPAHFWRLANETPIDAERTYEPGVASHLLRGEVAHLYSVAFEDYPFVERPSVRGTVWNIATSLVEHPRFDLLSLEDPGPFARDLLNAVRASLPKLPDSLESIGSIRSPEDERRVDDELTTPGRTDDSRNPDVPPEEHSSR